MAGSAQLILSRKRNEDFTQEDIINLLDAGVRECDLEKALRQLGIILVEHVLPIIQSESDKAVTSFKFKRLVPLLLSPEKYRSFSKN